MASKINYNNKAPFQTLEEIPDENKVNANDMNEIKTVVNNNADELNTAKENIENLQGGQGTSNAEITSLKNRVTALETDNTTNKSDINNLKTDNETNKSDIEELQEDNETNKTNITNLQNNKVDKEEGKGLSTYDFTNEYKQKLDNLSNYDDAEIKADIEELEEKVSTLEEDNTTNKTNIEALQEDNTQNKTNIEDLQESQEEQDSDIEALINALPSETQENESINIKGTIPVKFKEFKVSGNSKQETTDTMPSPEYPSPIQNVEGDVNVTVANKEGTEQQVVTFPLATGQKLYKGDYLADDGIHKVKNQFIFDGTENFIMQNQRDDNIFYTGIQISEMEELLIDNLLSSHFKGIANPSRNVGIGGLYKNFLYLGIEVETIGALSTQTEEEKRNLFKTWLAQQKQAGTPVIIEYELAEEEIEPYTEEQEEAYNQICNLKAYEGETNIYSTEEISPIFKVTAIKDFNSAITQLNNLILEGGN